MLVNLRKKYVNINNLKSNLNCEYDFWTENKFIKVNKYTKRKFLKNLIWKSNFHFSNWEVSHGTIFIWNHESEIMKEVGLKSEIFGFSIEKI